MRATGAKTVTCRDASMWRLRRLLSRPHRCLRRRRRCPSLPWSLPSLPRSLPSLCPRPTSLLSHRFYRHSCDRHLAPLRPAMMLHRAALYTLVGLHHAHIPSPRPSNTLVPATTYVKVMSVTSPDITSPSQRLMRCVVRAPAWCICDVLPSFTPCCVGV